MKERKIKLEIKNLLTLSSKHVIIHIFIFSVFLIITKELSFNCVYDVYNIVLAAILATETEYQFNAMSCRKG